MVAALAWQASFLPELAPPEVSSEVGTATIGLLALGLFVYQVGLGQSVATAGLMFRGGTASGDQNAPENVIESPNCANVPGAPRSRRMPSNTDMFRVAVSPIDRT